MSKNTELTIDVINLEEMDTVYQEIRDIILQARKTIYRKIDHEVVLAHWKSGKVIVEQEQKGQRRAGYGQALLETLSRKLTEDFGKGYSISNIKNMRQFYLTYPKRQSLIGELSWTHYLKLMRLDNPTARQFYELETVKNNWGTRELERQINTSLYERVGLSKEKQKVRDLSKQGALIDSPEDMIRDPLILDFLGLPENNQYLEKDLEQALIDKLQQFLLELGKGFSFVSRQQRITVDGDHYYCDLVLFNYVLNCFCLLDLKIGKLRPSDTGNLRFYVNYWDDKEKLEHHNPTIGIILCAEKSDAVVKYTLGDSKNNLFATKYKTYLPSEKELQQELVRERALIEQYQKLNAPNHES